jgi:L-serine/L-threonine ammonia-lyase
MLCSHQGALKFVVLERKCAKQRKMDVKMLYVQVEEMQDSRSHIRGKFKKINVILRKCLNLPVTVVVPESTPEFMRNKIADEGASVVVKGKVWNEANDYALQLLSSSTEPSIYVHPFDDPVLWDGHATIIEELYHQLPRKPNLIVTVVGGGGLLCGILQGLHQVGWTDVPVLACETKGAESFALSYEKKELSTLTDITSIAKSLGAKQICKKAFEWIGKHPIYSHVVSDASALNACKNFVNDHRVLVEPACGAG